MNAIKHILIVITVFSLLSSTISSAHNKVVVIPLAGDDLNPLKNVISVALENGDFDNPISAMDSINDATAENPYLVVIAPGTYFLSGPLRMKEYVSIAGSGPNISRLQCHPFDFTPEHIAQVSCIVGADNTALSDILVKTTSFNISVGLYNDNIENMDIRNLNIESASGGEFWGVYNFRSSPRLSDLHINIGGVDRAYGIFNNRSGPAIRNSNIVVNGTGSMHYGIFNQANSEPIISNVSVSSVGASVHNIGIYEEDGSSRLRINNSTIDTLVVHNSLPPKAFVSNSDIAQTPFGKLRCSFVFLSGGIEANSNCKLN